MKETTIEELAYIIKRAKEHNHERPIFFLGAGASVTGNIPLASKIVEDIKLRYSDNPTILKLKTKDQNNYSKLMECLLPFERDELMKSYIKNAKINVTHIYLARLLTNGYVDYVLTVNFDNLMLRALSLFNEFPPTYDMAILKDLTTTSFKKKSVVYLHGQHHGLWLLNTKEEMDKVKTTVPRIFDSIKHGRPWIFIGYSGNDPIFEHIVQLGRFDNGLYWVTYNDHDPESNVKKFLEKPNTNAFVIKGYDSDSFMLKLNSELSLEQPTIIDKPFSSLKEMLSNIVDIDDAEHFKSVKQRLNISRKQVDGAILQYEKGEIKVTKNELMKSSEIDILKKDIINLMITKKYSQNEIDKIESKSKKLDNSEVNSLLADLFFSWGTYLGEQAEKKEGKESERLFNHAIVKFKKVIEIKPHHHKVYNNWGTYLGQLAKSEEGKEEDELYNQAFEKFQKAIEIEPENDVVFSNWGTYLGEKAKIKEGKEADNLYNQAFEKFQKVIEIKPDNKVVYFNWGSCLGEKAHTKEGKEAEDLYNHSIKKLQKALEIKPDDYEAYCNLGTILGELAKSKEGKEEDELYNKAFEIFQKALEIKPEDSKTIYNWGTYLANMAMTKKGKVAEDLYKQAFEKFGKSIELEGDSYNLSCLYALKNDKKNALKYLEDCLSKGKTKVADVRKDKDWESFHSDKDYIDLLKKYEK